MYWRISAICTRFSAIRAVRRASLSAIVGPCRVFGRALYRGPAFPFRLRSNDSQPP